MKRTSVNISYLLKTAIVLILTSAVSSGIRVIAGIVSGVHGAPDFVTPQFQIFAVITQFLLIMSYIIFEKYIPVHNKILKGLTFIILFWSSDYISQILGLSGASSTILSSEALSVSTLLTDSAGYLICGIILGAVLSTDKNNYKKPCRSGRLFLSSLTSMLLFPCVLGILELVLGSLNRNFTSVAAFGVIKEDIIRFYIVFYLFQAISGFLFPVFYRLTVYNSNKKRKWLLFANVYALMLWTPVVLIVAFFGADAVVTAVYAALMAAAIYADTFVFSRIIEK